MAIPGTARFAELNATPSPPPAGYAILYVKTDNVVYLQDSSGVEVPLGSASSITSLTGDVTATGPGAAAATVVSVGGATAANIAAAVTAYLAATSANTPSTLVLRDASGNFNAGIITAALNGNAATATSATSATSFSGSLVGDVTGTQGATVVSTVGGATAANIASAVSDVQAATSVNTSSTIVERDASGNFAANVISAALNGNASTATSSTSFSGSLVGDVTGTQGATVVSTVGGKSASAISTSVDDTAAATAANTSSTIVKRDASGNFAANTITASLTGLANGVDASAHASRHLPAGADALTTAAPAAPLSATTTDAEGTANSLARSDHSHDILTATAIGLTPDQTSAEGSSSNLARADHVHNIPSGTPVQIGTGNFAGAASSFALSDHVHAHGNQTSGSLHAAATTSVNGFMSAADKTKLDTSTDANTASAIVQRDASGNFSAGTITADLAGAASANLLKAGDVMTGYFRTATVGLTDGASIATDAALGNIFTVTIAGNRTMSAPTNPLADQKITYRIRQDATGGRSIGWDAAFNFGVDLSGIPNSTSPNAFDYYGFQYNAVTSRWDCLAISRGY